MTKEENVFIKVQLYARLNALRTMENTEISRSIRSGHLIWNYPVHCMYYQRHYGVSKPYP